MMTIFDQLIQRQYDEWGKNPPDHTWCNKQRTQVEVTFLKNILQLTKIHSVLDVFCSWGRHATALAHQGYNVTGIDVSGPMIAQAKQNAAKEQGNVRFVVADIHHMSFEDHFDRVYSIQSSPFEAWRSPQEIISMLTRIRRALRFQGMYLFGWPNNWNRGDVAASRWKEELKRAGETHLCEQELPFHYYGITEQTNIVSQAGFRFVRAYNNYENWTEPYLEAKPGLIMLVEKSNETSYQRSNDEK